MRFASIVGARPQFIKIAPVSALLRQHHEEVVIHTGQHYDYMLSAHFFKELSIPEPDYFLECGSGTHGAQTARMLAAIEQVLMKEQVDWVLVYGDTNSTLAAALAATKLHIPIAHVEAGLRSFNRTMPEEVNRIVTDHISDRLFCPTETAHKQLLAEGITQGVSVVGDVMYDTLLHVQPRLADQAHMLLATLGLTPHNYILTTVHRAANTDDAATMQAIAYALNKLEMPVLFPVHPRTKACLHRYHIQWEPFVQLIEPVGYLDMLALQYAAYRILTDSGGIQKEAFLLGVPCVTLREETEWIETVQSGWNILAGSNWQNILNAVARPKPQPPQSNPFGRGDAARRIVQSWQRRGE
ncbi:non-hydrolyzing UDP-N-acetylglucosamine 2-epimerase [Dictyobacter formicarum]|uniref:UDP-N-acetyl glucosamine 2-epimerase n=1 Tax=Dictyobacter formicarum TaxID=2778368 RepID=A0ABQ3VAF7_9CHLR|nr:UDP-N-acetyl glucosamine 2-epimerase [Dictyobacter formicarum]